MQYFSSGAREVLIRGSIDFTKLECENQHKYSDFPGWFSVETDHKSISRNQGSLTKPRDLHFPYKDASSANQGTEQALARLNTPRLKLFARLALVRLLPAPGVFAGLVRVL
jgi:hypothetical protein